MAGSWHSSIILACSFLYIFMVFFMLTAFSCSSYFPIQCLWIHRPHEILLSRISHLLPHSDSTHHDLYLLFTDLLCCDSVHFRVRNGYTCNCRFQRKIMRLHMYICKRMTCFFVRNAGMHTSLYWSMIVILAARIDT